MGKSTALCVLLFAAPALAAGDVMLILGAPLESALVQARLGQAKAQAAPPVTTSKPALGGASSRQAATAASQPSEKTDVDPALVSPDALYGAMKTTPAPPEARDDWAKLDAAQQQEALKTYARALSAWKLSHSYTGKTVSWSLKLQQAQMNEDQKLLSVVGKSPQGHLVYTAVSPAQKDKWMKLARDADIRLDGEIISYEIGDGVLRVVLGPLRVLFGVEIEADHIIFLLDATGSMSTQNVFSAGKDGVSRCIQNLDLPVTFNIIMDFADRPRSYSPAMVPARKDEKPKAVKYLGDLLAQGKGNAPAAVDLAIKNIPASGTTCICYVTDGDLGDFDAVIQKFAALNADGRKVPINMFVLGETSNQKIMDTAQKIATDSGGVFRQVQE